MKRLREIRHGDHLAAEGIEAQRSQREREALMRVSASLTTIVAEALTIYLNRLRLKE